MECKLVGLMSTPHMFSHFSVVCYSSSVSTLKYDLKYIRI
jgi:hypothetical protein